MRKNTFHPGGNYMVSKKAKLKSLSMSDLKKIAKASHIDLTPSFIDQQKIKIMGEKFYVVEKLSKPGLLKMEDIDKILGIDHIKKPARGREVRETEYEEEDQEDEEIEINVETLLSDFFYKEDLQLMLDELELPVSGNKDELIDRIIESGEIDEIEIIRTWMVKDQLQDLCDTLELKRTGKNEELIDRIFEYLGIEEEEESEEEPEPAPIPVYARQPPLPQSEPIIPSQTQMEQPQVSQSIPPIPQREAPQVQYPQDFSENEFNQLVQGISQWIPSIRHSKEDGYRSELVGFLQYQRRYFIRQESGENLADIMVNEKYPIEVKKNPKQSEYDRLLGQMVRHYRANKCIIAVVCDVRRLEQFEDFKRNIEFFFKDPRKVIVINK